MLQLNHEFSPLCSKCDESASKSVHVIQEINRPSSIFKGVLIL
jgi:hypothetical protein